MTLTLCNLVIKLITTLYISSLHTSEPILKPSTATMASIVRMLSQDVDSEEFVMPVRREHVLEDALRSLKRRTFSPNLTLSVCLCLMYMHTYSIHKVQTR